MGENYIRLSEFADVKSYLGQRINIAFLAKEVNIRKQKNNLDFMIILMKDGGKQLEAKYFQIPPEVKNAIKSGRVYGAVVDVRRYDKAPEGFSCIIAEIEELDVEPTVFVEWAEHLEYHVQVITKYLEILKGSIYQDITTNILKREWGKFSVWTAGKKLHHTRLGDLICHTASVVNLAFNIASTTNDIYKTTKINMQLLIAGALLHDIGKIYELDVDIVSGITNYSELSNYQTHIMRGILEVDREARNLGVDPNNSDIVLLEHLLASHHGLYEWGSPIKPANIEALILHAADKYDAEVYKYIVEE